MLNIPEVFINFACSKQILLTECVKNTQTNSKNWMPWYAQNNFRFSCSIEVFLHTYPFFCLSVGAIGILFNKIKKSDFKVHYNSTGLGGQDHLVAPGCEAQSERQCLQSYWLDFQYLELYQKSCSLKLHLASIIIRSPLYQGAG